MTEENFTVAGTKHYKKPEELSEIRIGDSLHFTPEPTNQFDPNAIMVHHPELGHVGYIPKRMNVGLYWRVGGAQKLIELSGEVSAVSPEKGLISCHLEYEPVEEED